MAKKKGKKGEAFAIAIVKQKVSGTAIGVFKDGRVVAEADRLEGEFGDKIYLTTVGSKSATRRRNIKVHRTEEQAVRRVASALPSKRFPQITPRLRKAL